MESITEDNIKESKITKNEYNVEPNREWLPAIQPAVAYPIDCFFRPARKSPCPEIRARTEKFFRLLEKATSASRNDWQYHLYAQRYALRLLRS